MDRDGGDDHGVLWQAAICRGIARQAGHGGSREAGREEEGCRESSPETRAPRDRREEGCRAAPPVESPDKQRKEPRLAAPAQQAYSKSDLKPQEMPVQEDIASDGSQRPQRWGFWRGNR